MDKKKPCNCPLCNSEFIPDGGLTASEHLYKGVFTTYKEMQVRENREECLPCPRCGEHRMSPIILHNALSRQADIYICDVCGMDEAIRAKDNRVMPAEEWWIVNEILPTSGGN